MKKSTRCGSAVCQVLDDHIGQTPPFPGEHGPRDGATKEVVSLGNRVTRVDRRCELCVRL